MGNFLELLGAIGQIVFSFTKDVTEEEIYNNIEFFKEYEWFQNYLKDVRFKKLINENTKVRYVIGKCNIEKMKKNKYNTLYQKKINKVLLMEIK